MSWGRLGFGRGRVGLAGCRGRRLCVGFVVGRNVSFEVGFLLFILFLLLSREGVYDFYERRGVGLEVGSVR